jgi:hypothetical protein
VLAFLSQAHVEPDITMEVFFVDGPLAGFGALEVSEPDLSAKVNAVLNGRNGASTGSGSSGASETPAPIDCPDIVDPAPAEPS